MGVFEFFPYTNFEQKNLDWFLNEWMKVKKQLEEDIALLETLIGEVEGRFTQLQDEIDVLNGAVVTINAHLTSLDSSIESITNDINTINESLSTTEGNISDLTTDLSSLHSTVDNLIVRVTEVEQTLADLEGVIETTAENVLRDLIDRGVLQVELVDEYDANTKALTLSLNFSGGN